MNVLEEYRDYARHSEVGHNYATPSGLRKRADAAIAELEAERDKYKWQRDEALADYCDVVEGEWGISHWPTDEQPPTLDDWLDDEAATAKWVGKCVADLDRRWEERDADA